MSVNTSMPRGDWPRWDAVSPSAAAAGRLKRATVKSHPTTTIGRSTVSRMPVSSASPFPADALYQPSVAGDGSVIAGLLLRGIQRTGPLSHVLGYRRQG